MDVFQLGLVILIGLAISDLVVGVSNDAANFLNSSLGSRVTSRRVIMIVASMGMLVGVTFSSGMMEVARKGIFNPQFFTMPELMTVFLAVMLTDIILLDLYNTFGLPTSTTVSIVFELLGAAVAVSLLKLFLAGEGLTGVLEYINTAKALTIIFGILLSVGVAFVVGAVVQFLSRIILTFDYERRIRRYGALWGGVALTSITYFILIKGSRGASFISDATLAWIKGHTGLILLVSFLFSALLLQFLLTLTKVLLIAGTIMVATLWISRKARTVQRTEIGLGRQDEGFERFESTVLSRAIVRTVSTIFRGGTRFVPAGARSWVAGRFDRSNARPVPDADGNVPSFDLIRAGVNLMVASALIAFATSLKLPLSTTYVTFMVAMGTSLSDQAWGRESAVYRVTGVLTVIGGWFFTAMMAFSVSSVFATAIYFGKFPAVLFIAGLGAAHFARTRLLHKKREVAHTSAEIFNLRKIKDSEAALNVTFEHTGIFLREVSRVLNMALQGVFDNDRMKLREAKNAQRQIQQWSNIIAANIFKVLRLLQWAEVADTHRYAQTISSLQEISESVRDIALRGHLHVANNHAGLLEEQKAEIDLVRRKLVDILDQTSEVLLERKPPRLTRVGESNRALRLLVQEYDENQIMRIQDNASKTRLSILFYSIMWDVLKIAEQTTYLLEVFRDPLRSNKDVTNAPPRAGQ